jgi:hypothetical protein
VSALTGVRAGLALGARRIVPRMAGLAGGAALLTLVVVLVERRTAGASGLDRALHIVSSWFIPLLALAVVTAALGARSLRDLTWSAARFGASRQAVALGIVIATSIACVVAAVPCVAIAFASATPEGAAPLAKDLLTSGWIAAESAWAYAAWLALGATFGKLGGGRGIVVALDYVFGGLGAAGLAFPRSHTMNLLGFDAAAVVSQRASSVLLPVVAVVATLLASLRCRD